jgi:hypothetical protein
MGRLAHRRTSWVLFLLGSSASLVGVSALADPAPQVGPSVAAPRVVVVPPTIDVLLERHTKLSQRLKPEVRAHLEAAGREVSARLAQRSPPGQKPRTPLDVAREVAKTSLPNLGALANGDIETLVVLVMMEAARSADADLKALLVELKRANTSRAQLRQFQASRAAGAAELRGAMKAEYADAGAGDSLYSLGELQQARLMMVMDRMAKYEAIIENMLRKIDDTQSSIISNMK